LVIATGDHNYNVVWPRPKHQ